MMNFLVAVARVFLLTQLAVGLIILGFMGLVLVTGGQFSWVQMAGLCGVAFVLLAMAGFTAILFQISDRLGELVQQGRSSVAAPPRRAVTEPSISARPVRRAQDD